MAGRTVPKGLRWFFFALAVGSLLAAGVYLGTAVSVGGSLPRLLRALMFLLLGLFWVLMYGEHESASPSSIAKARRG